MKLERNLWLKRNWLGRFLVILILTGANPAGGSVTANQLLELEISTEEPAMKDVSKTPREGLAAKSVSLEPLSSMQGGRQESTTQIVVWLGKENGNNNLKALGSNAASRPEGATHKLTIPVSRAVSVSGVERQSPGSRPTGKIIKIALKRHADGSLQFLESDPPGKGDKSDATDLIVIKVSERVTLSGAITSDPPFRA